MTCQYCKGICRKAGRQRNGAQKLYCRHCRKYQQSIYYYRAYATEIDYQLQTLVCESVSIRGISRILRISASTVIRRIKRIAAGIHKPTIEAESPCYEVDELWTYIGRKDNDCWLAYALDRKTRQVVDFVVGKRTKRTLKELIERLLTIKPRIIRTDKLTVYQRLIPSALHRAGAYCINHIERKNLSIRTHIKRLSRRTICFSRDIKMLDSCLRIYFWR
jgi:IS1 family transposase/transposase-like protein